LGLRTGDIAVGNSGDVGVGISQKLSRFTVVGKASFIGSGAVDYSGTSLTQHSGTTTKFLSEIGIGDTVQVNNQGKTVTAIDSDTSLTVDSSWSGSGTDWSFAILPSTFRVESSAHEVLMAINHSIGLVGIGTLPLLGSPQSQLEVKPTVTENASYIGIKSGIVYNGGETMANCYLNYIAAPSGSGTITNKYALVTEANAGNVGVGLTSPGSKFQVNGNAAIGYSASQAAPSNGLLVAGAVGLAQTSPASGLHIGANAGGTGKGYIIEEDVGSTPALSVNGQMAIYTKGNKICIAKRVSGTTRYTSIDMSANGNSWTTSTTTAP
jgi:hypothetical protein